MTHPVKRDPLPSDDEINVQLESVGLVMRTLDDGPVWVAEIVEPPDPGVEEDPTAHFCVQSTGIVLETVRRNCIQWAADQGYLGAEWKHQP